MNTSATHNHPVTQPHRLLRRSPYPHHQLASWIFLLTITTTSLGCQPAGWLAHGLFGDNKTSLIKAQHPGLQNKTAAVIVAADDQTLYAYPNAPGDICKSVTNLLAQAVPGIQMTNPNIIARFQRTNIHWDSLPNRQLIKSLGVDRVVFIDLAQFGTHEPGDANVLLGNAIATVSVLLSDATNPDNPAFSTTVSAQYPEKSSAGRINADDAVAQQQLIAALSRKIAHLFHDYQVTTP